MKYTIVTVLAGSLLATAFAACSADTGQEPAPSPEEPTATAAFALTAQCGVCAGQAVANVCGPQALACAQDPNCNNAGACVQACAPGDALCLAGCLQSATALLDELAECVVCNECPVECAGAWQCSSGGSGGAGGSGGSSDSGGSGGAAEPPPPPAGSCDNSGNCQACVACAAQGPCSAQTQACLADPSCMLGGKLAEDVYKCTVCSECANDCQGVSLPQASLSCP